MVVKSTKKDKIKVIFFDFWGTLVENGVFPSPVRQAHRILRVQMPFSDYIERFEEAFMTKKFDTLTEAFHNVAEEFGLNPPEFVYDKLIGMWNKNTFLCKPFEDTIKSLEELKKDYKIVLISNTDNLSIPQVMDKFKLTKYFDKVILSCEEGKLKTNKDLFLETIKELKLKPANALMIGDSIPTDMKGAENAGIRGILLDRNDRREYENKITKLEQIKEKI